jgi:hypothetical protein
MMSEGKSTVMVMETVVEAATAEMSVSGMTEATPMAKSAVSHSTAATVATTTTTMHGRRRDHRTRCEGRRRGQSDHQFAQHDLSSICYDEQQLRAPLVE